MVEIRSKHALFQDPPSSSHHRHHHVFFSALQREENLDGPLRGSFPGGALIRYFVNTLSHKYTQIKQMLADPLLTEHYAKAGLRAVLIDQQHGLSFSSY